MWWFRSFIDAPDPRSPRTPLRQTTFRWDPHRWTSHPLDPLRMTLLRRTPLRRTPLRRTLGPPGVRTTARELQTCTFEGPGASNTIKIPRKDPKKREERKKIVAGEGKKSAKFCPLSTRRGPTRRAPTPRAPHHSDPDRPHPDHSQQDRLPSPPLSRPPPPRPKNNFKKCKIRFKKIFYNTNFKKALKKLFQGFLNDI